MEPSTLKHLLKTKMVGMSVCCGLDRLFRYLNRKKLLVVMYHGVTSQSYSPPVWSQLPVEIFRRQLAFLRHHYHVVTLAEFTAALDDKGTLPERAALITFDDGIKNNFSVAYPVLQEFGIPASIFLTVDLVGTRELLWFDELYLLILEGVRRGIPLDMLGADANRHYLDGNLWEAYVHCVESVKRSGGATRATLLERLRREVPIERDSWLEEFGLLNWDDVATMEQSGLVSFGVHTATHRILSELDDTELASEVLAPRTIVASRTVGEVSSFCFPNGHPGLDFHPKHQDFLRQCGYRCAFTTENALFNWRSGDPMMVGRVAAGSDGASEPPYFRLNTSGALSFVKKMFGV